MVKPIDNVSTSEGSGSTGFSASGTTTLVDGSVVVSTSAVGSQPIIFLTPYVEPVETTPIELGVFWDVESTTSVTRTDGGVTASVTGSLDYQASNSSATQTKENVHRAVSSGTYISDSDFTVGATEFTLAFWVRFDTGASNYELFSASNGTTTERYRWYVTGNKLTHLNSHSGGSTTTAEDPIITEQGANEWYHYIFQHNASGTTIYQNNIDITSNFSGTYSMVTPWSTLRPAVTQFKIHRYDLSTHSPNTVEYMSDIFAYNGTLSAPERLQVMNRGSVVIPTPAAVHVSTYTSGESFTITSANTSDSRQVNWGIV